MAILKDAENTACASIHWTLENVLPQDTVKSQSREIQVYIFQIDLDLDRQIGSSVHDACQISERYYHYNIQSRGFETSQDLMVKRFIQYMARI